MVSRLNTRISLLEFKLYPAPCVYALAYGRRHLGKGHGFIFALQLFRESFFFPFCLAASSLIPVKIQPGRGRGKTATAESLDVVNTASLSVHLCTVSAIDNLSNILHFLNLSLVETSPVKLIIRDSLFFFPGRGRHEETLCVHPLWPSRAMKPSDL